MRSEKQRDQKRERERDEERVTESEREKKREREREREKKREKRGEKPINRPPCGACVGVVRHRTLLPCHARTHPLSPNPASKATPPPHAHCCAADSSQKSCLWPCAPAVPVQTGKTLPIPHRHPAYPQTKCWSAQGNWAKHQPNFPSVGAALTEGTRNPL